MDEWLAIRFEENRARLRAVAGRMLGSSAEADDAVQETWLRLSRADTGDVQNLGGWLTTVVSRVCLDMLRSRAARREDPFAAESIDSLSIGSVSIDSVSNDPRSGAAGSGSVGTPVPDPEREALLADAIGPALLVVLDTLTPAERLAFVLHDLFAVPFDEIAPIVGRSPAATRQLASRARRRVQGRAQDSPSDPGIEPGIDTGTNAGSETRVDAGIDAGVDTPVDTALAAADLARRRQIVQAFLNASRRGDFAALLAALDPDVALRADGAAVRTGAEAEVRGARAVAGTFSGRAKAARPALVDGAPGLAWVQGGAARAVFAFTIDGDRIIAIDLLVEPDTLARMELVLGRG